jgi:hypothetical protein
LHAIINDFAHAATHAVAYRSVSVMMRGHGILMTLAIGAAIIGAIILIKRR